jgi:hypothetical protein
MERGPADFHTGPMRKALAFVADRKFRGNRETENPYSHA